MSISGYSRLLANVLAFLLAACLLGAGEAESFGWMADSAGVAAANFTAVAVADSAAVGAADRTAATGVDSIAIAGMESNKAGTTEAPRHLWFESEQGPLWLGEVTRQDILNRFPEWQQEYDAYQPDPEQIAELRTVAVPVTVLCVLGTWCSDSRREVPRFWKLLDLARNTHLSLQMLAVARRADAQAEHELLAGLGFADDLRDDHGVELVPTFIFLTESGELGRIVESPEYSLEHDAAAILCGLVPSPAPPSWR